MFFELFQWIASVLMIKYDRNRARIVSLHLAIKWNERIVNDRRYNPPFEYVGLQESGNVESSNSSQAFRHPAFTKKKEKKSLGAGQRPRKSLLDNTLASEMLRTCFSSGAEEEEVLAVKKIQGVLRTKGRQIEFRTFSFFKQINK